MAEISARTGITFDIMETATEAEYEEKALSDDVVLKLDTGMTASEAELKNYKCTDPYLELSVSAISLKKNENRKTIAAVRDTRLTKTYVEKREAKEDITYYDTMDECVNAVKSGRQDITYADTYSAQRILSEDATNKLTSTIEPAFTTQLQIGVKTDAPVELLTILNKGVNSLGTNQIKNMVNENCDFTNKAYSIEGFMYNNPFLAGLIICLLFIVVIAIILIGFRQKRTMYEKEKNREFERFIKYVCKTNDEVSELDMARGCKNVYRVSEGKVVMEKRPMNDVKDAKVHPDDRATLERVLAVENIRNLVDTDDEIYLEYRLEIEEGQYQWHAFTAQGMERDKAHPNSCMVFDKNIDEAKHLEEQRRQQQHLEEQRRQQLQDALAMAQSASAAKGSFMSRMSHEILAMAQSASAAKGSFMSRMSHEIRTPLNAIIGYISLEKASDTLEEIQSFVDKSEIAAKNLLGLLNDILDISSIESGRMKIAHELFDFKQLLSAMSTMYYSQCQQKGITFETILTDITEESLVGDRLRLNQILNNLLSNAVKFTPKDGRITLGVIQQRIQENRTGKRGNCTKIRRHRLGTIHRQKPSGYDGRHHPSGYPKGKGHHL